MSGASESDENDNEWLFGGREPDEDVAGDSWGGVDPHAGISRERALTMERIVVEDERAWAEGRQDDEQSEGSRQQDDLTFDGFDEKLFKVEGPAIPLLRSQCVMWTPLSGHLGPTEMRPKRAMRIGVISPFFRRDADFFRQWQLPKGHESRAQATAALVSLLFAGTAMGLMSGKHEENTRNHHQPDADGQAESGKRKAAPVLRHVSRYTYIPALDDVDSHPMFQIGLEEMYNEGQTEVLAMGVWLFVSARRSVPTNHSPTHPPSTPPALN